MASREDRVRATIDRPTDNRPTIDRPGRVALAIAVVAQALFLFRLSMPHSLVFDEVHYVPAARALLALSGPVNTEHPLAGKELIALGMALFGDNSFGWRVASTLAGTATVLGTYSIAWLIWGRVRTAAIAAVIVLLNITVFVQARIAMLDGFMAAFVVTGYACLLWSMRAETRAKAWWRWLAGAALLGLATATKWLAAPYIAFAGLALIAARLGGGRRLGTGLATIPALASLGAVSIGAYFLTFAPTFFYAAEPMTLPGLLPFQRLMYAQQTQVLPPHPYQSVWWTWPLMIRPIWYLYERADDAQRGILMIGNPAVLWGGLIAVAACLWGGWRDGDRRRLAVAGLWIFSLGLWALIPKSLGFFYYYHLSSIWLALPIAAALDRHAVGRWRGWDEAYLALVLGLFIYFFPIISALPLAGPGSFRHWMWFPTWP
jgi:dolichyl-phosphate-mannose--protein O-mannosyl transferase